MLAFFAIAAGTIGLAAIVSANESTNNNLSRDEIHTIREQHLEDMQQWAEEEGIDLSNIMPDDKENDERFKMSRHMAK